jgi:hypothetical protein
MVSNESDVPAAVDQPDLTSRQRRAQAGRALGEGGVDTAVGSAVDGDRGYLLAVIHRTL